MTDDDEPLHPYQHAEHTMTWDDRLDWYFQVNAEPLQLGISVKVMR